MKNTAAASDGGVKTAFLQQLRSEELEPFCSARDVQEMAHLRLILWIAHCSMNGVSLVE